jgi:hypothetical protein
MYDANDDIITAKNSRAYSDYPSEFKDYNTYPVPTKI